MKKIKIETYFPIDRETNLLTYDCLSDINTIEKNYPELYKELGVKYHPSDISQQLISQLLSVDENIALRVAAGDVIGPSCLSFENPVGKELIDFLGRQDLFFLVKKKIIYKKDSASLMVYLIHEDFIYHNPEDLEKDGY